MKPIGAGVVPYYMDGRGDGLWSKGAQQLMGLPPKVDAGALRAVLQGRDPRDGRFLPSRRPARRRGGWDLAFCAPKSLSLWAATAAVAASAVRSAHDQAVIGVLDHVEEGLRARRCNAAGQPERAHGLLAATFRHELNAVSEPHLHTHVLVANLTRSDGGWGAVRQHDWFTERESLTGLYQLALRHHMRAAGWDLDWRMRADGLADLADVPRAAIRAVSSQSRHAAMRDRRRESSPPKAWQPSAAAAGWDTGLLPSRPATGSATGTTGAEVLEDPGVERAVTARLAGRRSDFRRADVVVALAGTAAQGALPRQALAWVDRYCAASPSVASPTTSPRWTTVMARRADEDLLLVLEELSRRHPSAVRVLEARPGTTGLLSHAELLARDLARSADPRPEAAVASSSGLDESRWAVLAGLRPHHTGDKAAVVVVDQADRRTSTDLARLAGSALRSDAQLVLVEGGTRPRLTNPASRGLTEFADRFGRIAPVEPGPWVPAPVPARPGHQLTGSEAAADLLARWSARPAQMLVGLGPEEVHALNRAARCFLSGGDSTAGLVAGDRVVVLRGRPGLPPRGTVGLVTDAGGASGSLAVHWDDERLPSRHRRDAAAGLGYGYAVTPRLALRSGRDLMLLGPRDSAPRLRSRLVASVEAPRRSRSVEFGLE